MTGDSIALNIRDIRCPNCNQLLQKHGFTKHGHYQRYWCKSCKKQWVELVPPRAMVLRGHIKNYDD